MSEIIKNIPISEHLILFSNYLENNGRSKSTIKSYENELRYIFNSLPFSDDGLSINQLVGDELLPNGVKFNFQLMMQNILTHFRDVEGNSKPTIARKVNCLKSYFGFLQEMDIIINNPMKKIKPPKLDEKEKDIPSIEETQQLLDYYYNKYLPKIRGVEKQLIKIKEGNIKIMNKLIQRRERWILLMEKKATLVRFLYSTGSRISEATNIKFKDIDTRDFVVLLHGKGKKDRRVPIDIETTNLIIKIKDKLNLSEEDYVFTNRYGNKYSTPVGIDKEFREVISKDLGVKWHPHLIRGAYTTHLGELGEDIQNLQDNLGHSSPNTTRSYLKTKLRGRQRSYNQKHPLMKKI